MKISLVLMTLALTLTACGAAAPSASTPQQREIRDLTAQMEEIHPNLFHAISRRRFTAEVERLAQRAPTLSRAELVIGLMRIAFIRPNAVMLSGARGGLGGTSGARAPGMS